jgi:copper oxidase (laccase) domain-containing protein
VVGPARSAFGDRVGEVLRPDPGNGERWMFDLWAANRRQLLDAGVPAGQIQVAGMGTGPGTPFFSHRFEGPTGRFAAFARLA